MSIIIFLLGIILMLIFIIKNKPFKIAGTICFIISFIIGLNAIIGDYNYKKVSENFKNSKSILYIVTKNESSDKKSYFKINDKGEARKIKKFKYLENETLYIDFGCFDDYINHDINKGLNIFNEDKCKIIDKDRNIIEYDNTIKDILVKSSKLEHSILYGKILKYKDDYYVFLAFNVNIWSPCKIYKYENGKLKHIYTFDGEEVISIKEKVRE